MTSTAVVLAVLAVEGVLVALTLLAIFAHALWYRRSAARRAGALAVGGDAVVAALAGTATDADRAALAALPRRALIRLLADIAPSLAGPHRATIAALAERLGLVASATAQLHSVFWWRRLQGARLLTLVGASTSVLAALRDDRHGLLRAQRAEALGFEPSDANAEELIALLGDRDGTVRATARESLMRLGASAQGALLHRLEEGVPAHLPVLLDVAAAVPDPRFLSAALIHSGNATPDVRVRAARLLRAVGTMSAIDRLTELLADSSAAVRAAAAASLGSLGHWPAASPLARLLDDADADVRVGAAAALQRLGAPGELLLRRARDRGTGYGADLARQVLEMADRLRVSPA